MADAVRALVGAWEIQHYLSFAGTDGTYGDPLRATETTKADVKRDDDEYKPKYLDRRTMPKYVMTLTYTNHLGDTVTLGAPGGHVHYGETDLFGHKWSYEHDGQRVWGMSLDAREVTLPVCELGGSLAEREGVYRTLEADAEEGARGTLSYHGWELGVIPIASSLDQWWWDDGVEERSVTLLVPRPLWTRDETVTYQIARADGTTQPGSDYPRDYPWEYARPSLAHVAVVDAGSAEWRWVVYGPAVDPWVVIEGNRHEVDVTVPSGSRLELDTRDRTIRM